MMTDVPAESTLAPLLLQFLQVWLKSDWLDIGSESRFEPGRPEYESASWQLRRSNIWGGFSPPFDGRFDHRVKSAWFLPWHFSRKPFEMIHGGRGGANFVIRHVGHWNGDSDHYEAILSTITRSLRAARYRGQIHRIFALTPFSIIVQHFTDEASRHYSGNIAHTEILFFYTFENFIQEALAKSAHNSGIAPDAIAGAYEHAYGTSSDDTLTRDPGELGLAALATDFSWTGIREHIPMPRSSGGLPELRRTLFYCRLETHLMVAFAVACHGIASLQQAAYASPLVVPLPSVPTIGDLAPFWLRHLVGAYDHGDACMRLLDSLARYHEVNVKLHPGGEIEPQMPIRNEAEESILYSKAPMFGQRGDPIDGRDSFRWESSILRSTTMH
jgi:hypothetical protein